MAEGNVFLQDIDVPEVVRKKADTAFSAVRAERDSMMKKEYREEKNAAGNAGESKSGGAGRNGVRSGVKAIRTFAAIAACAAVIAVAVTCLPADILRRSTQDGAAGAEGLSGPLETETAQSDAGQMAQGEVTQKDAAQDEGILDALDHMFTLRVRAAELEEGKAVPLLDKPSAVGGPDAGGASSAVNQSQLVGQKAGSSVLGGGEGEVNYCVNMPLTCEGDNIRQITYSINKGAFQVVQPEGETIIIGGQLYEGELNTGIIGGDYDESGLPSRPFEMVLYRSLTLDYERQTDAYTWINICNVCPDEDGELLNLLWGEEYSLADENKGMQKLFDQTVITCTVQYADGTSQSSDILVDSQIMTYREAGEESPTERADDEAVFVTFLRQ